MNPVLRTGIAITALAFPALLFAADPPSAGGIDLGAMKLKKATPAPTAGGVPQSAGPAAAGAVSTAPVGSATLPAVQRQPSSAPIARQPLTQQVATQQQQAVTQQAATQPAATPQAPARQPVTTQNVAANQTGVGTVVGTAPIGRRPAADILGQKDQTQQASGDVQVKMPTMFKKVNPGQ